MDIIDDYLCELFGKNKEMEVIKIHTTTTACYQKK